MSLGGEHGVISRIWWFDGATTRINKEGNMGGTHLISFHGSLGLVMMNELQH